MNITFHDKNGIKTDIIKNLVMSVLDILSDIGVPFENTTDRAKEQMALSCLTLCGVKTTFSESSQIAPITTKQIISIWNKDYNDNMKAGSYDSLRDGALTRLIESGVILKEEKKSRNSSNAGYFAPIELVNLFLSLNTDEWMQGLEEMKIAANENRKKQNSQKAQEKKQNENCVEIPVANFITQHDKETFTDEQLSDILKEMCLNGKMDKNLAKHMFGILYAPHLQSKNLNRVVEKALPGEATVEEGKGKNIGLYLRNYIKALSNYALKHEECNIRIKYLDALRTKPFMLLAGISGTGKSRIVRELAFKSCPSYLRDKDGTTPGNYCMIEVKPNWHDSSELLGYYSNISKKYIFTKFVKFLVRAMMHPNVPFFVCLDEMNLAPVEQYFAEFLSVIETRKLIKVDDDVHVVTGNLVKPEHFVIVEEKEIGGIKTESKKYLTDKEWFYKFYEDEDLTDKEKEIVNTHTDFVLKEKGLTLPENVFVIGTVNMDDTTHQFSRKVIDRAMTIEMNGGDLEDIFGGASDLEYPTGPDNEILSMATLKAKYVCADDAINKCARIKDDENYCRFITGKDIDGNILSNKEETKDEDTLPRRLKAINDILENTPFQVSYRVFNELVIYLAVLCDDEANKDKDIKELATTAFDQIALMKILPRIEGDYDMFNTSGDKNKLEQLQALFVENSSSWKKLDEMIKRLNTTEFTRFWP